MDVLYEPREKKRRRHPVRHALIKLVLVLVLLAVILAAATVGLLYVAPVSLFMLDPAEDLSIASDLSLYRIICLSGSTKGSRLLFSSLYITIPSEYISARLSYFFLKTTSGAI